MSKSPDIVHVKSKFKQVPFISGEDSAKMGHHPVKFDTIQNL